MSAGRAATRPRARRRAHRVAPLALVVALALALGLGGCRRDGGERLRRGDRLVTGMISDPKTFNPIMTTDSASSAAVDEVFEGLVRLNPRTTLPEPMLAERWEHDEAGTTWTFHLRRNVRWHDGTPLTAADVVFTLQAIFDPTVPNSAKHILTVGGEPIVAEAVDAHTVRLLMREPFAPLLNSIGVAILPRHVLGAALADGTFAQQWGIDTPPAELIGTGPYRLVRYEPAQLLHYERNPDYWMSADGAEPGEAEAADAPTEAAGAPGAGGEPLPRTAAQTLLIVPDQNTMYLKFLDGQLHWYEPRPEEVSDVRKRATALDVSMERLGIDTGTLFVSFNRNPARYGSGPDHDPRLDWFTDPRFVQAIAHSVDTASMIRNTYFGHGEPATSYISPENAQFHHPDLPPHAYDLERARALLAEGGYRDRDGDGILEDARGRRVRFELSTNAGNLVRERLCSILKDDWTKLGIEVHYRPLDFTTLVERLTSSFEWDAMVMGFTGGVEPHNASNLLRSSGNLHLWHPNQERPATPWEAEIDRALDLGARELDPAKRRRHYWRIQEILHREMPMIQLVRQERFIAAKAYLRDFHPTVWGLYRPERIAIAP